MNDITEETEMTAQEFLDFMNSGSQVTAECGVHQTMHRLSQEAIRITMEIEGEEGSTEWCEAVSDEE